MKGRGWMELKLILDRFPTPTGPRTRGGHAALYQAFWDHYDELAKHMLPPRRPDWVQITDDLVARGYTNGWGKLLKPTRTQTLFWRVGVDRDKIAEGQQRRRRRRTKKEEAAPEAAPKQAASLEKSEDQRLVNDAGAVPPSDAPESDRMALGWARGPKTIKGNNEP